MGISPSCDQFAVDNPGLVDESGCPPDAMAEDAAVNSLIATIFGWLVFRCLAEGEIGDGKIKMVLSLVLTLYITYWIYYVAQPNERPLEGIAFFALGSSKPFP